MSVSSVSFGKVVAVTGKYRKTQHLRCEMANTKNVAVIDAYEYYRDAIGKGVLSEAAKKYKAVDIYVTGDDYISLKNQEEGWQTLSEVASHLDTYYDLKKTSTNIVKQNLQEEE